VNATASMMYAAWYPHRPTRTAPSIGPAICPTPPASDASALAAGSCRGGSSRGIIEERAGEFIAKQTAWSATIA